MTKNKLQQNVPRLRFPGFEGEWKVKKISEIGDVITGSTPATSDISLYGNEYDFVGPSDIDGGRYVLDSRIKLSKRGYEKARKIRKGSTLFICIGSTIGKIAQSRKDCTTNQQINSVIPNLNYDDDFIFLAIQNQAKRISRQAGEQAVPIISKGLYQENKLYIPNLLEQQKIANFLTAIDDKISALDKKVIALKQYKKGIMQKIFSQQIRFRDENGGLYASWKEVKLGDLGSFKSGIGFPESQQGRCFGIPFYKVSDMNLANNETTMTTSNNYVDSNQIRQNKYNIIDKPSIIFAKVGAAIFLERKRKAENFLIDNNMMAFIPNKTVNYEFINFTFQKIRLSRMAQSGALPSYNGSDLKIIKISIPARISEQQKIANILTAIDQKITAEESKLKTAKEWKKGLLQRMFV